MGTDVPKPYLFLKGKTVLERTLSCFLELDSLEQVVVSTSEKYAEQTSEMLSRLFQDIDTQVVLGGDRRQDSIFNALQEVLGSVNYVAVHDAVRPFVRQKIISECIRKSADAGAAITGVPVKDTIKRVSADGVIIESPDRSQLWQAQTPQVFRKDIYRDAFEYANDHHIDVTDDASLLEAMGVDVRMVEGDRENFKLTYPIDFKIAEMLVEEFKS